MELDSRLDTIFRLTPLQKKGLHKLKLKTVQDLVFYFPFRYGDVAEVRQISSLKKDETVLVYGRIRSIKTSKSFRGRMPMAQAIIEDETGTMKLTWFHQPYIAKMIKEDALVKVQGKVSLYKDNPAMTNPEIEMVEDVPMSVGDSLFAESKEEPFSYPVYTETRGVTSRWIFHALQKIFSSGLLTTLEDPLPEEVKKRYSLPDLRTALIWIHMPKRKEDAQSAQKRFAFEEIFLIQIQNKLERARFKEKGSFIINTPEKKLEEFTSRFSFSLTTAQQRAINTVLNDFKKPYAMSRLLEGDVGSGKTAVAAATCFAVTTTPPKGQDYGNLQVAYMAPTEILAEQHFESFIEFFKHLPIKIGLITSSGCKKFPSKLNENSWTSISRTQLLKWVANGEVPILIGTHSLIQEKVKFENLAYTIIDEQHRFGTNQRAKLRRKDEILPHLLSMTATPIPRTLALTIYGDLDLTLLDEMPAGRKKVITEIIPPEQRTAMYKKVQGELDKGRQAYVICPRIDEPDPDLLNALQAKSVVAESKRLKKEVFKKNTIGVLHGKMKPREKEDVMNQFKQHKTDILVSTSVVEVGVSVVNATVMIIEGAQRYGLAQLHQLRGRVVRGTHQAYCFAFSDSSTQTSVDRLTALKKAKNGFELAEFDLKQRGAGLLYGRKQWGLSDLAMDSLKNIKMVEAARSEAQLIVETDPKLTHHPILKQVTEREEKKIHLE